MATVKAIPDGYSSVTPFLNIRGAAEAIEPADMPKRVAEAMKNTK